MALSFFVPRVCRTKKAFDLVLNARRRRVLHSRASGRFSSGAAAMLRSLCRKGVTLASHDGHLRAVARAFR